MPDISTADGIDWTNEPLRHCYGVGVHAALVGVRSHLEGSKVQKLNQWLTEHLEPWVTANPDGSPPPKMPDLNDSFFRYVQA